jgi:hypothetical protein
MFVTDTVDAIYPPTSWQPQAIMDRLGDILLDPHHIGPTTLVATSSSALIDPTSLEADPLSEVSSTDVNQDVPRHPLLTKRRIDTISELEPFFSSVSLGAYESVYRSGKVDWALVERGLEDDLFDG